VHPCPEEAVCDGPQALLSEGFGEYLRKLEAAAELAGKTLAAV
jgi:3-deoxy-7-phosphoheptulonate synthase